MIDHRGQGAGGAPDLVAALDGQLVVDVALGERLGGAREGHQAAGEMAGEREGQRQSGQQRQRADDQRQAGGAGLGVGETCVGCRALAVGAVDVGADGTGDAVGGLVDGAGDELGGADAVAALDAHVQLGVLVLEPLCGGVDRGHRARVVGHGAQGGQARLEDLEIALLVAAQRSVGEHHLRLGEVRVGERGVRVLGGHDPRHDAGRHPLVSALQRVMLARLTAMIAAVSARIAPKQRPSLTDRRMFPTRGMRRGDGGRMALESADDAPA